MIKINLLSPDDRIDSRWEKINHLLIVNAFFVVAVQLVFIFLVFLSIGYLNAENQKFGEELNKIQLNTEAKEVEKMKSNIKDYKDKLERIDRIQKDHLYWTNLLDSFTQTVPDKVEISKFVVDLKEEGSEKNKKGRKDKNLKRGEYIVKIEGIAKDIEDVLKFENNLKNSGIFNITISPSNYAKRHDDAYFRFKYDTVIDSEMLQQTD